MASLYSQTDASVRDKIKRLSPARASFSRIIETQVPHSLRRSCADSRMGGRRRTRSAVVRSGAPDLGPAGVVDALAERVKRATFSQSLAKRRLERETKG